MGIEEEFCVEQMADNEFMKFVCGICRLLMRASTTVQTPCKHVFCKDCITSWLKESWSCPYCRQYVWTNDLAKLKQAEPELYDSLSRIRVKCDNFTEHACTWEGPMRGMEGHFQTTCPGGVMRCADCCRKHMRKDLAEHKKTCMPRKRKERRIASAVEWDIEGLDALFENPVEKTGSPSPFRGVVFLPRPFAAECAPTVVRPASSPYIPPRARSGGLWPGRTVRLRRLYDA
eukprot:TRINITY_DN5062_c0_g1_i1.p1 TRINITY_DN5062_c0_g1~~TRINITY_DN5062_c0_g1_i1.p1  ORF type:complete len:231 (+),score=16.13 TRINITY_DN5062_c0_g1_i1:1593-2285(+)